ncbi:multiheme c-type cytochrome [Geoalkalibacter halelectricus]|uniref:multiheme c-type cytochrome n=1 Tax=Geoalkalibacter halelectricus TaxID=2847045 RepID=UPI003D22EA33
MKRVRVTIFSLLLLAVPLVLAGCGSSSSTDEFTPRAQVSFVGPDRCGACHVDAYDAWKDSWHTLKATYGPAFEGQNAGVSNINPWVRDNWDSLKSHMIIDAVPNSVADADSRIPRGSLYLTEKKYSLNEVAIVVGATRKQRYAVYYDGSAVARAYVAKTEDNGISYHIIEENGVPIVVSAPENKDRAGYNFLFIEIGLTGANAAPSGNNYGEFRSWQERCIGCHTTGFDADAWNTAKSDYKAGNRADLKDIFVADIRISCESCHGAGAAHAERPSRSNIVNPARLQGEQAMAVCGQCHTRTAGNTLHAGGSNDNRGFSLYDYVIHDGRSLMEVFDYTRPAWGSGNRQVSNDGKGRRDHQQDMDIMLTDYIKNELGRGVPNPHGGETCFHCHNAHGVGSNVALRASGQPHLTTSPLTGDPDGTIRLKGTREQMCGTCHAGQVDDYLKVLDGRAGYDGPNPGFGNFNSLKGRADKKQHIFSTDDEGRSFGLYPEEYIWTFRIGTAANNKDNYSAIWPWEIEKFQNNAAFEVVYGEAPWDGLVTDGRRDVPLVTALGFTGPGGCVACHKSAHNEWKDSWHTLKATYGPAFEPGGKGAQAGTGNFNPWVLENWDSLKSYMILDQIPAAVADADPDIPSGSLYLTPYLHTPQDVAIIVGATRKQRYAVYYDGSPVDGALIAEPVGTGYQIVDGVTRDYLGNPQRAGYNFLFIEIGLTGATPAPSGNNYGEFRSWQERCIGCHTTGFDPEAWRDAKQEYVDGDRDHLKDLFVADIRVSCESCHGPGELHASTRNPAHIVNPVDLQGAARQAVCGQCHTRTAGNTLFGQGSNDQRGYVVGGDLELMDVFEYTRPAWGVGNRQVSADGKGRRDHQQDMDIMLTDYIYGGDSLHGSQACFDCHNAHGVGSNVPLADAGQPHLLTANDPDGLIRLNEPRQQMCGSCHVNVSRVLGVLNGQTGWEGAENDPFRGRADRKQHIFAADRDGRSFGLFPDEYIWAYQISENAEEASSYRSIWPWEIETYEANAAFDVVFGEAPWDN